jgi:hypothetical protein
MSTTQKQKNRKVIAAAIIAVIVIAGAYLYMNQTSQGLGFRITLIDSNGNSHVYKTTGLNGLTVTVGGTTITEVDVDVVYNLVYTGSPSSASSSAMALSVSVDGTVKDAKSNNPLTSVPVSGQDTYIYSQRGSNPQASFYWVTAGVLQTWAPAGTHTLSFAGTLNVVLNYPDGSTASRTATASGTLTYTYTAATTGGSITSLTITLVPGTFSGTGGSI